MPRNEDSASKELRFSKVNCEDSILSHEMKEQLSFLRGELKSKNEVINILLKDRIGDEDLREAMPRSPFQTLVVAPERSGCQLIDERVKQRTEQTQRDLHSTQKSPAKSRGSTRNRSLPNTAIPVQNSFSLLSSETEENQSSNSKGFQEASQNTERPLNKEPKKKQTRGINTSNNSDKWKSNVTILGDSIVKHVEGRRIQHSLKSQQRITVKSFPGATTEDMNHYAIPTMKKKPRMLILHVGTNDLKSGQTPCEIARKIHKLAENLKSNDTEVVISEIVARADSNEANDKVIAVNEEVRRICEAGDIELISNSNINPQIHLNLSKLHQNRYGTSVLVNNLIKRIKK